MIMEEQWKDIIDYEGLYQVSNLGNVKSLNYNHTGKEQILKASKTKDGYFQVPLWKNGERKWSRVHRLVASHFIPNDDLFKTQINHKDENKQNNNVNNLEWCNLQYNNNYGTRNKRIAKSNTNNQNRSKSVSQYSLDGTFIREWQSMSEIKRKLGYQQANICYCCKGKYKTSYGFIWKYKNDDE